MEKFILLVVSLFKTTFNFRQKAPVRKRSYKYTKNKPAISVSVEDPKPHYETNHLERENEQLTQAIRGGYGKKTLLNDTEAMIFKIISKIIKDSRLYCFPQVSCGEIFTHKDKDTYLATVNSKRVDFCITNSQFNPIAIVEYQGSGHQLSGDSGKRDTVKSIAAQNVGIKFIQVLNGENYKDKLNDGLSCFLKEKQPAL